MTLRELARSHGKTLGDLGIGSYARIINCGAQRAGPRVIAAIAATLGVPAITVSSACDEAWKRRHGQSLPTHPTPEVA